MATVTIKSLLEAGVHFGHQTRRWNPKMTDYIFGERDGVHIIDLEQTLGYLHEAEAAAERVAKDGGTVLFVGTKRQGKDILRSAAERAKMPYINERWLGGFLTNFDTVKTRLERLRKLRAGKEAGDWDRLPKGEQAMLQRELSRLETTLGGVADLEKRPEALFVNDVVREKWTVAEAKKLGIPVIGVVDSNANPQGIDHPIPGNDDAVSAISLIAEAIATAVAKGREAYEKSSKAVQQAKEAEATKGEKKPATASSSGSAIPAAKGAA
ncbi:MAG TPA: 30S ribosomal protein S2 [Patescibacteria group bacterium]|jgi:small subunit ribosomal protein S2